MKSSLHPMTLLLLSVIGIHVFVGSAQAYFVINCGKPVVSERVDPISDAGRLAQHAHDVLGGSGFNLTSNNFHVTVLGTAMFLKPEHEGRSSVLVAYPDTIPTQPFPLLVKVLTRQLLTPQTVDYSDTQASNCTTCRVTKDLSNYWFPKMYYHATNDSFVKVPLTGGTNIYYK